MLDEHPHLKTFLFSFLLLGLLSAAGYLIWHYFGPEKTTQAATDTVPPKDCNVDGDCTGNKTCNSDGKCVSAPTECSSDTGCDQGEECNAQGKCEVPTKEEGPPGEDKNTTEPPSELSALEQAFIVFGSIAVAVAFIAFLFYLRNKGKTGDEDETDDESDADPFNPVVTSQEQKKAQDFLTKLNSRSGKYKGKADSAALKGSQTFARNKDNTKKLISEISEYYFGDKEALDKLTDLDTFFKVTYFKNDDTHRRQFKKITDIKNKVNKILKKAMEGKMNKTDVKAQLRKFYFDSMLKPKLETLAIGYGEHAKYVHENEKVENKS